MSRINSLRYGIEACDEAIKMLAEQPQIVIYGDHGLVNLNAPTIGLSRKSRAFIAKLITIKIGARRKILAKTLETVLDAVKAVLPEEAEEHIDPAPKAFGTVSADDVDLW